MEWNEASCIGYTQLLIQPQPKDNKKQLKDTKHQQTSVETIKTRLKLISILTN